MTAPEPVLPVALPWAQGVLAAAAGLPIPDYGSPEWDALPYDSPARLAAAVVAAEVHRYEVATLADRLRVEIAEAAADARRAWLEEEQAGYAAIAAGLPADVFRPRPARFSPAREMHDVEGWPTVTRPAPAAPRGLPSTSAMIRRVS